MTHRRAGKTVACIHDLQRAAMRLHGRCARVCLSFALSQQSKAVAWDYLRSAMAPLRAIGASVHECELRVDYINGGQVRLYGADNPDALRGIYLDGIVLDEYADMDPRVWSEIIRPALADRPAGRYSSARPRAATPSSSCGGARRSEANWFSLMLKASETGLIPASELALAEGSQRGAIRAGVRMLVRRRGDRRLLRQAVGCAPSRTGVSATCPMIRRAGLDPWDLGLRDATAIWFAQVIGREIRIIDYYEASGVDLGHYVRELNARPYVYAGHIVPHDAQARELGTGKSRLEVLESFGLKTITLAPPHRIEDGINAVRVFIPKCWFDAQKCRARA